MSKFTKVLISATALLILVVAGCTVDEPAAPTLTVTQPNNIERGLNYIAIGNSLTAGYLDGGLVSTGQSASYPMQIATQLQGVAAAGFIQPYLSPPGVGSTTLSAGQISGVLHFNGSSIAVLDSTAAAAVPLLYPEIPGGGGATFAQYPSAYRNLGVPGATLSDVTNALGATTSQSVGNAFFDLILRNPTMGDYTMAEQCINAKPYLVTCWIGNNDVLGGATSGNPVIGENVTPVAAFTAMYESLITTIEDGILANSGVAPTIVVANIPSVTSAPYFVPEATFVAAAGAAIPYEESDVEYVLFPALSVIAADGFTPPLGSQYTLTSAEIADIATVTEGYNDAIDDIAEAHGIEVFDANTMLADLTVIEKSHFMLLLGQGMTVAEAAAATRFSLDGIHPNNAGYSLIANGFLEVISEVYSTSIPSIAVNMNWDPTYAFYGPKAAPGVNDVSYTGDCVGNAMRALFQ